MRFIGFKFSRGWAFFFGLVELVEGVGLPCIVLCIALSKKQRVGYVEMIGYSKRRDSSLNNTVANLPFSGVKYNIIILVALADKLPDPVVAVELHTSHRAL